MGWWFVPLRSKHVCSTVGDVVLTNLKRVGREKNYRSNGCHDSLVTLPTLVLWWLILDVVQEQNLAIVETHRWDEHGSHTLRAWSFTFAASPGLRKWLSIHNILNWGLLRKDLDFFGPSVCWSVRELLAAAFPPTPWHGSCPSGCWKSPCLMKILSPCTASIQCIETGKVGKAVVVLVSQNVDASAQVLAVDQLPPGIAWPS